MPDATKTWKIATAGFTAAGLGAAALIGVGSGRDNRPEPITLQEPTSLAGLGAPAPIAAAEPVEASPDGESLDSPLQSPDDSPLEQDSVDTPGPSPDGESADSPDNSADDSPSGVGSLDSPEPAPPPPTASTASLDSPAAPTRAAPARGVPSRDDSPDRRSVGGGGASNDSPDSSADSAD